VLSLAVAIDLRQKRVCRVREYGLAWACRAVSACVWLCGVCVCGDVLHMDGLDDVLRHVTRYLELACNCEVGFVRTVGIGCRVRGCVLAWVCLVVYGLSVFHRCDLKNSVFI
jgi:uncharacterized membrane protein YecN with MAPEG domain